MNTATGIITCNSLQREKRIPFMSPGDLKIVLPEDRVWCLGIDQSTSCTGLCIQDIEKDFQILIDVRRDTALQKRDFYRDLFYLIKRTVTDRKIRMVVMEKPAPKAQYASRVLEELKGHVEEWVLQIPELEAALSDSVFPQTWKSYIVDKSKGKNRSNDKFAIASDLVDRFPLLSSYLREYPFKDYDSFDACGILNGFLEYAFTPEGDEKIHGVKEKRHTSLVGYLWADQGDRDAIQNAFSFDPGMKVLHFTPLVYNEKANLHDNIRMASSNYSASCVALPREVLSQFIWKYGIDPDDESKVMLMLVLKKSDFTNGIVKGFKYALPWNEEIYDA